MTLLSRAGAALFVVSAVSLASATRAALPGNSTEGKRLYEANCTGCHDTGVFTRKDRSVRSLEGLKKQVGGCSHMVAGKQFSPFDNQNLIKYLNDTFYQFQ